MIFQFARHLLLRTPFKRAADYRADMQVFLDDHFFRAAIMVASPIFYTTLKRQRFLAAGLSDKELHTLQKYINRYCFRPTPFGLFSSISLVEWSVTPKHTQTSYQAYISTAMPVQHLLSGHILKNELHHTGAFESNPSIYRVLNEYRFFRTGLDESAKHRDYQLQSIAFSKLLKDLLTNCRSKRSHREIVSCIIRLVGCTAIEAEDYADFLIDSQLLLNTSRISITGRDQVEHLASGSINESKKSQVWSTLSPQNVEYTLITPAFIEKKAQELTTQWPTIGTINDNLSIILLKNPGAGPAAEQQEKIREGLAALELLTTQNPISSMSQFIQSFQQHFEGQTLPLLQALDPEAGIGYQQPETAKNNPLLETLNIPFKSKLNQGGTWTTVHSMLMECWLRDRSPDPVVRLISEDLEQLKTAAVPQQLLGMSVLFRILGNKVFIENAGGINAPALMGRFTVADKPIADAARLMAGQLESQNPDLIFAELLHLADPHIDNINRRAHIYQFEIPLTAASTVPKTNQIELSDLYIKIVNNMVMLFSEKHQKFVVPRLTSAYNHSLNKLPLFRFLADLPYQYGRSALALDLRQIFPNLRFYPRVEYKDAILHLATWVIDRDQLVKLQHSEMQKNAEAFKELNTAVRLPRYFALTEGDQELIFDRDAPLDIDFFCNCIRQKKEVIIKEFLAQPEAAQYNAYLLPTGPIILPKFTRLSKASLKVQRKYIPGSDWLYFKIYAPRMGINRLLLDLRQLLSRRYEGYKIGQWFFIRYEDHAPHIRLRLQVHPDSISEILLTFKAKLEGRIQQHVIRELQIDVYTRELERYAAGGIENTENFFWASSELVLSFLKHRKTTPVPGIHLFALYSTEQIISKMIPVLDEQINFTLESFQQFLPEFDAISSRVDLDKKYRELSPAIKTAFLLADPTILSGSLRSGNQFRQSLLSIQKQLGDTRDKDYLCSIIHMHLNRTFTDESRKQEMICYYLLYKYLQSVKGRNKSIDKNANGLS